MIVNGVMTADSRYICGSWASCNAHCRLPATRVVWPPLIFWLLYLLCIGNSILHSYLGFLALWRTWPSLLGLQVVVATHIGPLRRYTWPVS